MRTLAQSKTPLDRLNIPGRTMNPVRQLESCGQSPWLDDLHRDLIRKGELARLIKEDGLKGMTSNPTIFEKAIGETDEYKDQLEELLLGNGQLDDNAH